jgi:hypothetical protein
MTPGIFISPQREAEFCPLFAFYRELAGTDDVRDVTENPHAAGD